MFIFHSVPTKHFPDVTKMLTEKQQGEWSMFERITTAAYGKQRFFLEKHKRRFVVYDREKGGYTPLEDAYNNYINDLLGDAFR